MPGSVYYINTVTQYKTVTSSYLVDIFVNFASCVASSLCVCKVDVTVLVMVVSRCDGGCIQVFEMGTIKRSISALKIRNTGVYI